jgi:hypothetical protein
MPAMPNNRCRRSRPVAASQVCQANSSVHDHITSPWICTSVGAANVPAAIGAK